MLLFQFRNGNRLNPLFVPFFDLLVFVSDAAGPTQPFGLLG